MKHCLILIFSLTSLCCFPSLLFAQKDDVLTAFRKETDAFHKAYERVVKEDVKFQSHLKNERDRIKSRYEIDNNDSDSERRRKHDQKKNALQKNRDAKKKAEKNINVLRSNVNQYEISAISLQTKLEAMNLGGLFHFNYYGEEIRRSFSSSKIKTNYSKEKSISLSASSDPSIMLWAVENEIACMDAAGIDFSQDPIVPEMFANYKTFFRFYQSLEFCDKIVDICKKADNPSFTMQKELAWRMKQLEKDAARLNKLLMTNHPKLARKMALTDLAEEFIRYAKQNSRESHTFGSDLFDGFNKNSTNKLLTEKGFKKDFAGQLELLKGVASDVRVRPMANVSKHSPPPKNTSKKARPKKFKYDYTPFFADNPGKIPQAVLHDGTDTKMLNTATQVAANTTQDKGNTTTTDEKQVSTDELATFVKERDAFRKDHAHTNDILSGGMDEESVSALKATLTPSQCQQFEKNVKKRVANGETPAFAAAKAYIAIHTEEREGKNALTAAAIENLRDQMDAYLARKEVKQTEDNHDDGTVVFLDDEEETADDEQSDADDSGVEWK